MFNFEGSDDVHPRAAKRRKIEDTLKASKEPVKVGSKHSKKKYDLMTKYQIEWAMKAPWSKGVVQQDGLLHLVKCTTCSTPGQKPCVIASKWDTMN